MSNTVTWNAACEKVYLALKTLLVSKPVLQLCDLDKLYILRLKSLMYHSKYTSGRSRGYVTDSRFPVGSLTLV